MDISYHLDQVSFRYSDQWVLRDFSLDVCEGEIWGIIGPNGDRKSTRLNSSH